MQKIRIYYIIIFKGGANIKMTDEEQKKIFSKNLNYYINKSGKQQKEVAKDLGIIPSTFNTWCVGKILPRTGKIQSIADYFKIGKSDLLDDKSFLRGLQTKNGVIINVVGRVAAGIPIEAIEEIIDTEEIPEELAKTGTFFGLKIKGDSMTPNICNGDIVIVRKQQDAESGEIVIATINGQDAVCKRLRKYEGGIELISNNPTYLPMEFSNKEVSEKPVRVIGKVVELRRKF